MTQALHIVSFTVPWPANYGGAIDVFYKLKALHRCGIQIYLHCFKYDRKETKKIEKYCEKVFYYQRKTGLKSHFSRLPYNVISRKNRSLLKQLQKIEAPILFEGLHSCYYANHPTLANRYKMIRQCNIEYDYYSMLAKVERVWWRKLFMLIEAQKMKRFNSITKKVQLTLSVSQTETAKLKKEFPESHIEFIPCFHANNRISIEEGISSYILYHAKLSVAENEQAALFLIKDVFSKLDCTCIIAGMDPNKRLYEAAKDFSNIEIIANPTTRKMNHLIKHAQIHLLMTHQATGLKLKLLNSLFQGKHVIVNKKMVEGTSLESLCHICNTPLEMINKCNELITQPCNEKQKREEFLFPQYKNQEQAEKIKAYLPS